MHQFLLTMFIGSFFFCNTLIWAQQPNSTENNTCENATFININEANICPIYTQYGSTSNNNFDKPLLCNDTPLEGDYTDLFYKFIVPPSGRFKIDIDNIEYLAIYKNCNNNAITCRTEDEVNDNEFTATAGDTLICQLINTDFYRPLFSFCIEESFEKQLPFECSNTVLIDVNEFNLCPNNSITGKFIETDGVVIPFCGRLADHVSSALYYKFLTPKSGLIDVYTKDIYGYDLYVNCDTFAFTCSSNFPEFRTISLRPFDTTIIRFFDIFEANTFSFCIESPEIPVNDTCNINIPFAPVNETPGCEFTTAIDLHYYFRNNQENCITDFAPITYDVFYRVIVPSSGRFKFKATRGVFYSSIELSEKCSGEILWCSEYANTKTTTQLFTPGDTLIMRLNNRDRLNPFDFCIENAPASSNNECKDAMFINVLPINECINDKLIEVDPEFNSLNQPKSCSTYPDGNTFYKFVVPQNGQVLFRSAVPSPFASRDIYLVPSIYTSCNDTAAISCQTNNNSNLFKNLPPGDTLILELAAGADKEPFSFALTEAFTAPNDLCQNATTLPVVDIKDCTYSCINEKHIANLDMYSSFSSEEQSDVFFNFTAPLDGSVEIMIDKPKSLLGINIYNNCNEAPVYSENYGESNIKIENLIPNKSYILQVIGRYTSADYGICIADNIILKNNDCSSPKMVTVSATNNCEADFTTANAINYTFTNQGICRTNNQPDAYYQFIAPPSGIVGITVSSKFINNKFTIFTDCEDEVGTCTFSSPVYTGFPNLTPGDTILLQVVAQVGSRTNWSFCLSEVKAALADECENAQYIPNSSGSFLAVFNSTISEEDNCNPTADIDNFYEYTVPSSGRINIYDGTQYRALTISIYDSCGGDELYCGNYYRNKTIGNLPANQNVIIKLSGENVGTLSITFQIKDVPYPSNYNCENALSLEVISSSSMCLSNKQVIYSDSMDTLQLPQICDTIIGKSKESYYSFTAPDNSKIEINTNTNIGLEIYNGCDGDKLFCTKNFTSGIIEDLPQNELLILRMVQYFHSYYYIYHYEEHGLTICLSEVKPTLNNLCENATYIEVPVLYNLSKDIEEHDNNMIYNTLQQMPGCAAANVDIYYKVVVPNSGKLLVKADYPNNFSVDDYAGLSIYNTCGSEAIYCVDKLLQHTFENLPPGDTVFLQFHQIEAKKHSFVVIDGATIDNNTCENAKFITFNSVDECDKNLEKIYFEYYDYNFESNCVFNSNDAFYKFVVPADGNISITGGSTIALIEGCENVIYCSQNSIENSRITNLPPGDTLTLQLMRYKGYTGQIINFCLSTIEPSTNNNCENAKYLPISATDKCSDNLIIVNMANNTLSSLNTSCTYDRNIDIYFNVELLNTNSILLDFVDSINAGAIIYDECGETELFCTPRIDETIIKDLPEKFILRILDSFPRNFNLCISKPPCIAPISGSLIANEGCNIHNKQIIIKNELDELVEVISTDEEGNYITKYEHPCGNYTAEIGNFFTLACFNGNIGPLNFTLNDDTLRDGIDFVDNACTPPAVGTFNCDD